MSTEIKNTLFRFVTMRAPELVEKEKVQKTFVQHPELRRCFFYQYLGDHPENSTKVNLQNGANFLGGLDPTFKTLEALKLYVNQNNDQIGDNDFFEFATWLTANRTKFTLVELDEKLNFHNGVLRATALIGVDFEKKIVLWDNLLYQVIASKSSYVREAILSILAASLFLENRVALGNDIEALQKLAQARVIMPKEIFSPESSTIALKSKSGGKPEQLIISEPSQTMETALVLNHLIQIKNMGESISNIEKRYKKETEKELEGYKKEYDIQVAKAYENATKIEKVIIDPITKEETIVIEYKDLVLPTFDFQPKSTEIVYLYQYSKEADYFWIIENCATLLGYDTFSEIIGFAKEKETKLTQMQFERTSLNQKYKNSGGMLFPVEARIETAGQTFSFQSIASGSGRKILLEFSNLPTATALRPVGDYSIQFANGFAKTGTQITSTWVANKFQVTLFAQQSIENQSGGFTISGALKTPAGQIINFNGKGITVTSLITGRNSYALDPIANQAFPEFEINAPYVGNGAQTLVYNYAGKGTYEYINFIDVHDEEGTVTNPGAGALEYIPSSFGIKRLGIADYRKVEQEICCYVPGEVSHIENVMASEYKERSTRRLRRSEDTTTTTKEKETERLTDTSSTDRFEMNSEVASVLAEDTHVGGFVTMNAEYPKIKMSAGADFANNTTSEESNSQAISHAKEVTERVLDRVVQKVKEERVSKVIEEFEENNKHGYDNKGNDQHVSGVYRWVDKIYKNKIINYGKRLMYEFMIPEPAAFHTSAINEDNVKNDEIFTKPIDPRAHVDAIGTAVKLNLKDYSTVNEANAGFWGATLSAEFSAMPPLTLSVGKSIDFNDVDRNLTRSKSETISIPENYMSKTAKADFTGAYPGEPTGWGMNVFISMGNFAKTYEKTVKTTDTVLVTNYTKEFPVAVGTTNFHVLAINFTVNCELSAEAKTQWQIDTFNAIIKAYNAKLEEYNAKVKEAKTTQTEKLRTNPLFYRQIENMVMRKNCIEYLASHETLGKDKMLSGFGTKDIQVKYTDPKLETYAAKVKFFEQAFEWELMSYNFYPFYWAHKEKWLQLYNVDETDDAIFRAFLQSGMARVILTIRPGFEEAVNWYMATGQVWNGGQVPTMDDELFISIVDELRETEGEVEETWETRVPTSLTIIQAGSIGMEVPTALPCDEDCKDYKLFDSDGKPVLDKENKQVSTNPFKKRSTTLKGEFNEPPAIKPAGRQIENIDIKNGNLQLTTNSKPRKIVAQISVEAIKREMGLGEKE